ncbi:B12-binding domain-containing radical SAM protein [bacterium]|nr:B12-binding domain-containing radical SAM protein [bacterium]
MRVLFVEHIQVTLPIENLSAYLKRAGHAVDAFFDPGLFDDSNFHWPRVARRFSHVPLLLQKVSDWRPDLVCFSVVTDYFGWAATLASAIKEHFDVPIVIGGIHVTSVPEQVMTHPAFDFGVLGEGEEALAELCDALENAKPYESIANLAYKTGTPAGFHANPQRPFIQDLDSLPHPDKELLRDVWKRHYGARYHAIASRGCPHTCSYCCHSFLFKESRRQGLGRYLRMKSVDHFLDELESARVRYGIREILIHDNVLTADRAWFKEFARQYPKRVGLPYFCWVDPNSVDDEIAGLLESSGCAAAWIGVSRVPGQDDNVVNRAKFDKSMLRALDALRRTNIYVLADNIVGLPRQTNRDVENLIRLYLDHPVDRTVVFHIRYYPRIDLVKTALEAGDLTPEDVARIESDGGTKSFTMKDGNANDELMRLSNLLLFCVLIPRRVTEWLLADKRRLRLVPTRSLFLQQQFIADYVARLRRRKSRVPLISSSWRVGYNLVRDVLRRALYRGGPLTRYSPNVTLVRPRTAPAFPSAGFARLHTQGAGPLT